jgi:RNA polymerase sigma-70 factor (ECF subfamily)
VLVGRLEVPLFNFLRLGAESPEDAEELTQEAFLRAWQRLDSYDSRWKFSTWLFTLARRLAISRYRKRRRETTEARFEAAGNESEPSRIASRREERENLWEVVRRELNLEQQTALWLRYGEGLAVTEIARVLSKRASTVRVLLFRARGRLAEHLGTDDWALREEASVELCPAPSEGMIGGYR